jgi:hypothetical protein
MRGVFDLEVRRKPQAFAAVAVESVDFQSQPTDNSAVRALWCKADIAISSGTYSLGMAKNAAIRGTCGFVLTRSAEVLRRLVLRG